MTDRKKGRYIKERVADLLAMVGLETGFYHRYPCELSGGQNQRVVIACALSLEPALLVLDEPTSALDVSVQAQILQLLHKIQDQMGLAYLIISHDLVVVRQMADQIGVVIADKLWIRPGPPHFLTARATPIQKASCPPGSQYCNLTIL